ncbi:TPA: hypothetical protein ACTC22_002057, partial [Neisseria meningitidis]
KTIGQGRRKRNAALSGGVALCCFLFLFFCAYAFFNQGCRFGGLARLLLSILRLPIFFSVVRT